MAEKSAQDRTEKATPRRQKEALEKGQVAKSAELNSVAVLLSAMAMFGFISTQFGRTVQQFLIFVYGESSLVDITAESIHEQAYVVGKVLLSLVGPLLLAVFIAGLAINYAQVGFVFANKALIPDFKKISPLSGIKRLFSLRSLVELGKGLFKITVVSLIGYFVLSKYQDAYLHLTNKTPGEVVGFAVDVIFELGVKVGIALLVMAIGDFAFQKWQHEKNLKMTKQEVKDEAKHQEGDPLVKDRIRAMQRELSLHRMMAAVPDATVVITNPVHLAVALKYQPRKSSDAPVVVAKGQRKIAQRIKEIARQNMIPIVEDKPLARSLYDNCEIGMEIPIELYQAVAEILSQIYQSDRKRYTALKEDFDVSA